MRNVLVRVEAEGVTGYGEAAPNVFYEETWQGVVAKLEAARDWLAGVRPASVADLAVAWEEMWRLVAPSRAAQCALDVALWDWLARRQGVSACELAWGEAPRPVTTFCTIGLSSPEELAEKVAELRSFPRIKIKSDASGSLEPVRVVRDATDALLAVDANCAWGAADLDALAAGLAALRVEFIEQPLPPGDDARLAGWWGALPVLADESCVTEGDVERMAQSFAGFNIKLVKCGGITPARRMVLRGRALGLRLMVGCMIESSALIAAGAVIGQCTEYADLDGAWLIGNDPFSGWRFEAGMLTAPAGAGLGAEPEPGLFHA